MQSYLDFRPAAESNSISKSMRSSYSGLRYEVSIELRFSESVPPTTNEPEKGERERWAGNQVNQAFFP